MKNKKYSLAGFLGVLCGIVLAVVVVLFSHRVTSVGGSVATSNSAVDLTGQGAAAPDAATQNTDGASGDVSDGNDASADGGAGISGEASSAPLPILDQSNGDRVVVNASSGYYFAMPVGWYVERGDGTDGAGNTSASGAEIAVYPNYDPNTRVFAPAAVADTDADVPVMCKIEVSTLPTGNAADLDSWITVNLQADPTTDVGEISRTQMTIDGRAALTWRGALNGVTTTLTYAEVGGKVYEIAPSTLSDAADADNDACIPVAQTFIKNFHFGTYAQ